MKLLSAIVMATTLLLAGSNTAFAGHDFGHGYGSISSYGYIFNGSNKNRHSIYNYSQGFKFVSKFNSNSKFGFNFTQHHGSGSKFGSHFGTRPNCVSPVPEPTTAAMFALAPAMVGFAAMRRRKK